MKKLLLLSIAASAVLFAGGDIKEVVVPEETPVVPCPTSNLKWYGQTVLYYQTAEKFGAVSDFELFDGEVSKANAGIKLGVTGSNLLDTGLGFGVEVVALGSLGLEKDGDTVSAADVAAATLASSKVVLNNDGSNRFAYSKNPNVIGNPLTYNHDYVSDTMQKTSGGINGGELTQAYLTYTAGNTTAKVGRMYLPKSLSPLAFSEKWNVFSNSFEAALLINKDIADTTLVGAWVARANTSGNLGAWDNIGTNPYIKTELDLNADGTLDSVGLKDNNDGAFMLTAVNKSVAGLTLIGSVYYIPEASPLATGTNVLANGVNNEDVMALWGDAKFSTKVAGNTIAVGVQGGMIDAGNDDPSIAYGVKASGKFAIPAFGNVALCAAYTGVDLQGMINAPIMNVGDVKTPLYTQMVGNQNYISGNMSHFGEANTWMVKGSATYDLPALGNVAISVAYSGTEIVNGIPVTAVANPLAATINTNDFNELDVIAKTKLGDATVLAAYVNQTQDNSLAVRSNEIDTDIVRVWAKWDF